MPDFIINPAFERWPSEASLVGKILASFGEIELTICQCADAALDMQSSLIKALYLLKNTSSRVDLAESLMRNVYQASGLLDDFDATFEAVRSCTSIRNQYAHCNWVDDDEGGLFFADLQKSAKQPKFRHSYKHVDTDLLDDQLSFFGETLSALRYLDGELGVRQGRLRVHAFLKPKWSETPPLHNLESLHIPPFVGIDEQEAHLKRALESERPSRQPERAPSQPRLTEAQWIAKYRKEGRALPGESK